MDEILKQLNSAKKTVLTTTEKQTMRAHMEALVGGGSSPLHSHLEKISDIRGPQISPYKGNFFGVGMLVRAAAFILVGFIVGGTTLTFASTNSLPGDSLYPIKTRVTEPIRRVLALSVESTARYDSKRVQTRLAELKTLKDSGKLSDPLISIAAEDAVTGTFKDYSNSLAVLKKQGRSARASEIAQATLNTLDVSLTTSVAKTETTMMMVSNTRMQPATKTESSGTFKNKIIDNKLDSLSSELREISVIENNSNDREDQNIIKNEDIQIENKDVRKLDLNNPRLIKEYNTKDALTNSDNIPEKNTSTDQVSPRVILNHQKEATVNLPF